MSNGSSHKYGGEISHMMILNYTETRSGNCPVSGAFRPEPAFSAFGLASDGPIFNSEKATRES